MTYQAITDAAAELFWIPRRTMEPPPEEQTILTDRNPSCSICNEIPYSPEETSYRGIKRSDTPTGSGKRCAGQPAIQGPVETTPLCPGQPCPGHLFCRLYGSGARKWPDDAPRGSVRHARKNCRNLLMSSSSFEKSNRSNGSSLGAPPSLRITPRPNP